MPVAREYIITDTIDSQHLNLVTAYGRQGQSLPERGYKTKTHSSSGNFQILNTNL